MDSKAKTIKKFFSRETTISIEINSAPSNVWALLTNASDYSRWNSTIISIEGAIKLGETIRLKSKPDPKRTFKLKVKTFEIDRCLIWGDPMGKRTYKLQEIPSGGTIFTMTEKIGGPIFPLFARMIPSFDESFEQFASDLKHELEK